MKRQLGNDHNFWPQQILEFIYSDYPFIADYMQGIKFKTVDPSSGTAMGGIMLENKSTGMSAVIPLVISEFSLSNLDVFIVDDTQYIPLTITRLTEYLGKSMGKLKPKRKGRGDMPVKTSPPGKKSNNNIRKTASLFKAGAKKAGIGPGMLKIILDSMGKKEDNLIAKRIKSLLKDIPYRALWIFYSSNHKGWIALASDDRFNITKIEGREKILEELSKYDVNLAQEMDRSDNIFISREDRKPFIAEDFMEAPKPLTASGMSSVITSKNNTLIGYHVETVTDLLARPLGFSMWYNGEDYTIGEGFSGYYLRDSHAPRVTTIEKHKQYCFSFTEGAEQRCTAPFTALEKPSVVNKGLVFKAKTHFGKEITIKYSKEVDAPFSNLGDVAEDMEGEVIYYIPTSYKLNKVGNNKISLTYLTDKSFASVLADNLGYSIKIKGFNAEGVPHYYIKGKVAEKLVTLDDKDFDANFGKYATDENALIWYLINLGFSEGTSRAIIASVWQHNGEVTIGNVSPFKDTKINLNVPHELVSLAEDKLIPDSSVEAMLGLNFINDLDVLDALVYVEDIKQLESILAKLLFQVRLGVPLADEVNVTRALDYVSKVIDDLEIAKATLGKKVKK
jgi:hypothetical protein